MTEQFAFVDESLRSGRYLLGCVIVEEIATGPMRRNLRKLLPPTSVASTSASPTGLSGCASSARSLGGTSTPGSMNVITGNRWVRRQRVSLV